MVYDGQTDYIPDKDFKVEDEKIKYQKVSIEVFLATPYLRFTIREKIIQILSTISDEFYNIKLLPDESIASGDFQSKIKEFIWDSKVFIADLTGLNPNVIFELGLASGLGKEILLITQEDTTIPFDLAGNLFIVYDPSNIDELNLLMNNWFHSYFQKIRKEVGEDSAQKGL
ncbi:MAG: hypothetical protein ACFE96_18640 [Candidatus Hermodarchaeota archaeon]